MQSRQLLWRPAFRNYGEDWSSIARDHVIKLCKTFPNNDENTISQFLLSVSASSNKVKTHGPDATPDATPGWSWSQEERNAGWSQNGVGWRHSVSYFPSESSYFQTYSYPACACSARSVAELFYFKDKDKNAYAYIYSLARWIKSVSSCTLIHIQDQVPSV